MEFRDLKRQYSVNKHRIDQEIQKVLDGTSFIAGTQVRDLENTLAEYVGVKHCISCANGTDALQLALMTWNIGKGDAVFVPDFTFFASGEVVSAQGATPIFVDVREDTFNLDVNKLEKKIEKTISEGELIPKVIIAVDLFGQPAEYELIRAIARKYHMYVLEDAAQGFGGAIGNQKACSFGDISTTSFFPAKPLGCYGDGGAVFTDNDEWAALIRSFCVHGKGISKYDNVRIGMNSRLDTIQAAILQAKFPIFTTEELEACERIAKNYTEELAELVKTPVVLSGYVSSWAQYTIQLESEEIRDGLQSFLKENSIPSMVYYQKPMHLQKAFGSEEYLGDDLVITDKLCKTVLSLPFHPYMSEDEIFMVTSTIKKFMRCSHE